ncbi:MAG: hypothetical protein K9M07_02505 [Simkaniaceae bacterium]|nr:hypothetical protein [Simkaniaceae bacterium]
MRYAILGLGISGLAAARFLLEREEAVIGIDHVDKIAVIRQSYPLLPLGSDRGFNQDYDCLIVSPGIDPSHPIYSEARRKKIPILGEIELALQNASHRIIGVTGTKGKTTAVMRIEALLRAAGHRALAVGNIGDPLIAHLNEPEDTILVVELSSFQLETIVSKKFHSTAILNLSPDHLDRYPSFDAYKDAKRRLIDLTIGKCFVHHGISKRGLPIGPLSQVHPWMDDDLIALMHAMKTKGIKEQEWATYCMIYCLCRPFNVGQALFFQEMKAFRGAPHRIEYVGEINGVSFYNDSKATNAEAVVYATQVISQPKILLVGGKDKKLSYTLWKREFGHDIKKIIAYGEIREKIREDLTPRFDVELTHNLKEATERAMQIAEPGDAILLSPGTSSYDAFTNYEERGDAFKSYLWPAINR